jgi:hypothetical protein
LAAGQGSDIEQARMDLIGRYGFAVPTEDALRVVTEVSPNGVVEVGAGAGYWAYLLDQMGVDVLAFDSEPAPSMRNRWFAGSTPWYPVGSEGHEVAARYPEKTLLVVWPTKNEIWAAEALQAYHRVGGSSVVYVGEGAGGRTGDDVFHALLGDLTVCAQCTYGAVTSPCICNVPRLWDRVATVELPHWPGYRDDLHVFARHAPQKREKQWFRRC